MTESKARRMRNQINILKTVATQLKADLAVDYDWMVQKIVNDIDFFIQTTEPMLPQKIARK